MVLACALLLSGSGVFGASSAQGDPCLAEVADAHVCPPVPSAPDPLQAMACASDALSPVGDVTGLVETVTSAVNAVLTGHPEEVNATAGDADADMAAAAAGCCPCPPPCGQSIVSDSNTVWTHYNEFNANEGFRQPAATVAAHSAWSTGIQQATWTTGLPVPQYIWSYAGGNPAGHNPTRLPVMFERDFPSCIYHSNGVGQTGVVLRIIADDAFLVVFNGQVLSPATPPCNGQAFDAPDDTTCFTQVHTVALPPLVNAGSGAPNNQLTIYVWNHANGANPNPGMLRFRLDH